MLFWSKCLAVAAALTGAAFFYGILDALADQDLRTGAGVLAQIGATMLGFVLASLSILATIAHTKLLRNMQRTGHYAVLLRRMFGSVVAFGVLTVVAVVVLFLPAICPLYGYLLFLLAAFSVLTLLDVSRKFWTVLHHLHPTTSDTP